MTTTPPGWYVDAHGAMRWWDGASWTEHVATPRAAQPVVPEPTPVVFAAPGAAAQGAAYPGAAYSGGAARPYDRGHLADPDAYATYGGASIPATEPRTSRLWIVWVVVGVVLLAMVIALAVLIPTLLLDLPTDGGPFVASPSESADAEPADGVVSTADELDAVDAVEKYHASFQTGDCDAYFATTTEDYRAALEVDDCDTFALVSARMVERARYHEVVVRDVETDGEAVIVSMTESFTSGVDGEGDPTDGPIDYVEHLEYHVVWSTAGWAIDEFREDPSPEAIPSDEPVADPPANADEQAAVDAVELYNQAWLTGDCDAYFATTTEVLREEYEITDCTTFAFSSEGFAVGTVDFRTTIRNVETLGAAIAVSTTESSTSIYDEEGYETDTPAYYEYRYEYHLVDSDAGWVINEVFQD